VCHRKLDDETQQVINNHPFKDDIVFVYVAQWDTTDMSSSLLRTKWLAGEDISHLTHPKIVEYMKKHGIMTLKSKSATSSASSASAAASQPFGPKSQFTFPSPALESSRALVEILKQYFVPISPNLVDKVRILAHLPELNQPEPNGYRHRSFPISVGQSSKAHLSSWERGPEEKFRVCLIYWTKLSTQS